MRESFFPYSHDQVDALRMELQTVKPTAEAVYKRHANNVISFLQQKFKNHIPQAVLDKQRDLENRIIVTNTEQYNSITKNNETKGFYSRQGYIVVKEPSTFWDGVSDVFRKELIQHYGSERVARTQTMYSMFYSTLTHEIVHGTQKEGLPEWFLEAGASYYTRQFLTHDKVPIIVHEDINEERIEVFENLVSKYGESIHKIYFGQLPVPSLISKALNQVPEVKIKQLLNVKGRRP